MCVGWAFTNANTHPKRAQKAPTCTMKACGPWSATRPVAASGSIRRAMTTACVAVLPRPPGHLAGLIV